MRSYYLFFFLLSFISKPVAAASWVDSINFYAREKFLPPNKYQWKWQKAALLSAMVKQYDNYEGEKKKIYLDYIQKAMDKTASRANGKTPNAVASGLGMAFLYRVTKDDYYQNICENIFADYLKIKRTKEGAVSHLRKNIELWDDTVFMVGEFLIEMYRATKDEKYLDELVLQIREHRAKLRDEQSGLWVHGWDNDTRAHCTFCGKTFWPDKETRRSKEIWGRGNGWIVVTLSDALNVIPKSNKHYNLLAGYLKEMIEHLPEYQDKATGHWFQLPVRNTDPDNFIESSCTAMFAYGIQQALDLGLVQEEKYKNSVTMAYNGLRTHSVKELENGYLTTKNVCKGTCIGDKKYYLNRKVKNDKPFGIGMFIIFGRQYEGY